MLEPENARDRVIVQRIRNGDTYEAIGNDYGITRQRVQQIAEKYGVRPLGVDEKPLSGPDLLVADLLQSEPRLSYRDVSEHTGLSQRQVRRIAEKAGSAWMRWPVYRSGAFTAGTTTKTLTPGAGTGGTESRPRGTGG